MKKKKISLLLGFGAILAFVLWTLLIKTIDIKPIGPMGSAVGFSSLNGAFHEFTGVHLWLYNLTDLLSLIPILLMLSFASLGFIQLIKRKSLRKVDFDIIALGGFYAVLAMVFLFFEVFVINYRPVLINGILEASYPSSTTLLVMCVMLAAAMQFKKRILNQKLRKVAIFAANTFTVFMVLARLISGVHWLTDIIGGIFLSVGLVLIYYSIKE